MKNIACLLAIIAFAFGFGQNQKVKRTATIGFLNVENLWDTIPSADYIDGTKNFSNPAFHRSVPIDSLKYLDITDKDYAGPYGDYTLKGKKVVRKQYVNEEFTPQSAKNYNTKVYNAKLANESKVISELGRQQTGTAPVIVGMVEVENRKVIEDLIAQPALIKYNYGIVHFNSYDSRGVDVALIYQKNRFAVTNALKKELKIFNEEGRREYTRDILVVSGLLDGEKFAFFMNHWPSRRGGEAISLPKRNAAASLLKKQMDSIMAIDPVTKLVAMGDFNDDPVSSSLKNYLKSVGDPKKLSTETPYLNLMYPLFKKGIASLAYQDVPNLFDQIIVSKNLYNESKNLSPEYMVGYTEVYAPPYLITREGQFKGYPFRSWAGDTFTGGYSDHFPVFTIVQKEATLPPK